jgi:putative restriction endonuclease
MPWLDFLNRLDRILVYRRGEQRAPHKPLYLLFCIASLQHGLPRLQSFEIVSHALTEALRRFGLRTKTLHPEYPFWRLQNDALAIVEADAPLKYRKSNDDPTKSSLLQTKARGGLREQD